MTPQNTFVYIWKYVIKPDRKVDFLAAYQSDGEWVDLFSRDSNFIRTDFLQDANNNDTYMTIDHWISRSARDLFRLDYAREFDSLDKKCEAYTISEDYVGDFVLGTIPAHR